MAWILFIAGASQKDIAAAMGISRSRVYQMIVSASHHAAREATTPRQPKEPAFMARLRAAGAIPSRPRYGGPPGDGTLALADELRRRP
jgi:hypothetical protein